MTSTPRSRTVEGGPAESPGAPPRSETHDSDVPARIQKRPGVAASWTGDAQQTLALEAELQLGLIGSPNQLAAVAAGLTKRPTEFVDP